MAKYLYNGKEYPAIPDRDNTTSYAVICENLLFGVVTATFLYFLDTQLVRSDVNLTSASAEVNGVRYTLDGNGAWGEKANVSGTFTLNCNVVWSDYNILNTDGTLYLAASEPIPILAPALDPLSLFLGWKAGNWVARQRGKIQKWETLAEGTVETVASGTWYSGYIDTIDTDRLVSGETYRLTVDGKSEVFVCSLVFFLWCIGNPVFITSKAEDSGYDFCVWTGVDMDGAFGFVSRVAGSYSVKIERKVE